MLSRYYTYSQFEDHLRSLIKTFTPVPLHEMEIGKSVLNKSIYGIRIGEGKTKVLAWSQMHGNESTTTRAICDLLELENMDSLLKDIELYIIPVLNPDGAENWTRVNVNNIDLNRDSISLSQPESLVLHRIFEEFQPDYCFNLHGQRTIYGSQDGSVPAQISFLAPAGDLNKEVTDARLRSMNVINEMYQYLKNDVSGIIGRYNDDFNINCVGDFMMSKEVPTVLFEAGHAGDDYSRNEVTEIMIKAIRIALKSVNIEKSDKELILSNYLKIPQMSTCYTDILIKNYSSAAGKQSLCIQYHEQIEDEVLYFVPILVGVNRSDVLNGHRVVDLNKVANFKNDIVIDSNLQISSTSLNIKIFAN
ncbi:MAG: M14 family zinc carboxypeptidase [Nonlabens sp.]|uniref:M14 family zinc carboxypeptidase n=1 Tax=Nonlabens sp. TaxID=1888209 RepID=UPI00321AA343